MNKADIALVKIEQAFTKITATFDQRIARLMKSEEKRIALAVSDRKRKRVARRKELEANGEKIPKYLLEDDEKHLKSIFDIPRYITDAYERSYALSVVLDLQNIKTNVQDYCEFLARLKDSDNPTLHDSAYELLPQAQKLLSLIHIHRAHPDDCIKRANAIINPK
jgi:hypothetical protein